ncbi:MAG TPA: threonine--tRNA ligase, partial [Thermodesulfobacteriota bacterium]|nr:threonine--tRNA ligase [Thermodesulfobacteriota bacterium]
MRHTCAHVTAQALKRLFGERQVKLAIGPTIENGFYYDIDFPRPLTPEDLERVEAVMRQIVAEDLPIVGRQVSREEAIRFWQEREEPYKLEIIASIPEGEPLYHYTQGEFTDLCRGGHLASTGRIGAFRLLGVAGAYWRGDERNKMLQRIYGTAWPTAGELEAYLARLEEAKRRDHRKLGRELDLFSVSDEVGPGLVLWHPKGALVRKLIEDFWRAAHLAGGYELVFTPHLARRELWRTSGHLDFFAENMFGPVSVEGADYQLKPMNCPFHIQIYRTRQRSYRDLPIRWAELGTVYRYERSGVLHGLMRVRGFTQDDAHLFCRPDQMEAEIQRVLDFTLFILGAFGFAEFEVSLATRPEKATGAQTDWERATEALRRAVEARGLAYAVDEGGGAFYGPKIDVKIKDSLGRAWQCSTIQFDFNLPERFGLEYTGDDGKPHRPYMIHRALLGSLERFFGVLLEHYAGAFPLWLAPVQAVVLPVSPEVLGYAREVEAALAAAGLRVRLDARDETLSYKVREAQVQKIPYSLVVGRREAEGRLVAPRGRGGEAMPAEPLAGFIERLVREAAPPDPTPPGARG